jgi:acetoacetyl-CoA synthetase
VSELLWSPSKSKIKNSNLFKFKNLIEEKYNTNFGIDYNKLWKWSVYNNEDFWSECWNFFKLEGTKKKEIIKKNKIFHKTKFFPTSTLNFAKNLLVKKNNELSIFFRSETGFEKKLSWKQLYEKTCKFSAFLKKLGIIKGDRIAAYVPNTIETVITFLGTAKIGGIWSSCSPDFGIQGVVDRFLQIEPKILISANHYFYNGKKISLLDKIPEILKKIPSISHVVICNYDDEDTSHNYISLNNALEESTMDETFEEFAFNHPIYILYSSGTTGYPKCIVHGAGNALMEQMKELILHCDVKENDKLFYFTSTGWMMWNWLVAGLACKSSIYLYDGFPFYNNTDCLIKYCEQHQFSLFGVSAKYIDFLKKEKFDAKNYNLKNLKIITSTGSPLVKESFVYVYEKIKKDVHLGSISGGTDVVGVINICNPFSNIYAGEIQCPSLGIDVDVFDENGNSTKVGENGELVIKKPFPSMPVMFWNDKSEDKILKAYFKKYKNIWHHGDYIQKTKNGGYIIYGRSDSTLKPGGVRIGTSEIYRQVESFDEILESIVVGQNYQDDIRIILFIKLASGCIFSKELEDKIKKKIRTNCSPRHIPSKIIVCPDIPRTKSNKIVEVAVRKIINGDKIDNFEALANPESLEFFKKLKIDN